ncbi:RimK-like ATP-grasp domain-containing protein [Ruminiclostridium sufflavum DSM 19573]|uniref:RimK-like ATP-grasp domain-containing protein n=1 Tax=Ruminiclostridium sufflavum DSM 19573 TaxID=1121337 RepID=A0A318XFP1_9FIRM|nr:hypothetical protein [Ruminiclostridium sufflavum]PYG84277.1 RimK-like ATP-grasp domain-containing protein [Ruminiclostridium sufflavum DSM 19573]
MNEVDHLIISNTIDYSTDLICIQFQKRGLNYLRINRDKFLECNITYSIPDDSLIVKTTDEEYIIFGDSLKSIYFRAPVFLRSSKTYSLSQQLYRSQWSAFIRNLIVFDKCKWVNHLVSTYRAENKMYQLKVAKEVGFLIPDTIVGNCCTEFIKSSNFYIVKSLDTALFHDGNKELFTYSTKILGCELNDAELQEAPVIIQKYLEDKTDIRVTIVEDRLFPVKITKDSCGIEGDWRKMSKDLLEYSPITLPTDIENKIREIMKRLDLKFGGMDLILSNNNYYFIEVNPTGEWGWLKYESKLDIDIAIADCLSN